jgi:hypothetical protein
MKVVRTVAVDNKENTIPIFKAHQITKLTDTPSLAVAGHRYVMDYATRQRYDFNVISIVLD